MTAWTLTGGITTGQSLDFSGQLASNTAQDAVFSSTGAKVYMLRPDNATIYQYNLSGAWDLSTGSYASKSFQDAALVGSTPFAIQLKTDGTKLYICAALIGVVYVRQYTLSTPYDISTASYDTAAIVIAESTNPTAIRFKSDGTRMFLAGGGELKVFSYTLSVGWSITTTTYDTLSLDVSGQVSGFLNTFDMKTDGSKIYAYDSTPNDKIYQYTIGTPYNLSTGSYASISLTDPSIPDITNDDGSGFQWSSDGTKFYSIDQNGTTPKMYQNGFASTGSGTIMICCS